MYEKDKRTRLTIRLSEDQFEHVRKQSAILGVSPSDYVRMLINAVMYSQNQVKTEVLGRENDETIEHN